MDLTRECVKLKDTGRKRIGETTLLPVPAMDVILATFLLVLYMLIYVLPFYLFTSTRPSPSKSRNAIPVMRARIRSVIVSCCICSTTTLLIITYAYGELSISETAHLMGYLPLNLFEIFKSLFLTSVLFAGPLFEKGFVEAEWKNWIHFQGFQDTLSTWAGWRNYVVGPITEEVLFRSASIPLLILSHVSPSRIVWQTPLCFGLAHFHHFYEFYITHPDASLALAFLYSLLQFSYTTVFGAYTTFIYLRTSSLPSVILVHTFCNWLGFPRLWGILGEQDDVIAEDSSFKCSKTSRSKSRSPSVTSIINSRTFRYTATYYSLLIAGAWGWWKLLWPLTLSRNGLIDF